MKEEITKKLENTASEVFHLVFHCTDDVMQMDLSADKKAKISKMKFDVLSDFNKMVAEIKKEME